MGWTWYNAHNYKNGKVDRLKECIELLTEIDGKNGSWIPLKTKLVGSTVYSAVKRVKPDGETYVFAAVIATQTKNGYMDNFGYKDMDETEGPVEAKCPVSILNLLSPTENECAKKWRSRCVEYANEQSLKKGTPHVLHNLPVGTKISVTIDGITRTLEKRWLMLPFKTPVWWDDEAMEKNRSPFRILEKTIKECGYEVIYRPW